MDRFDTVIVRAGAAGGGEQAVVDPETLRIHDVQGLRVVDASIMPTIVSANTVAAA